MNHITALDSYLRTLAPADRAIARVVMREMTEPSGSPAPFPPPGVADTRPPRPETAAEVIFGADAGDEAMLAALGAWCNDGAGSPGAPDSAAAIAAYYMTLCHDEGPGRDHYSLPPVEISAEARAACERFFDRAEPFHFRVNQVDYLPGVARCIRDSAGPAPASLPLPAAVSLARAAASAAEAEVAEAVELGAEEEYADVGSLREVQRIRWESLSAAHRETAGALRAEARRLAEAADRLDAAARKRDAAARE